MPKKSSTAPLNNAEARARLSEARAYLEMAALNVASDSPAERKVSGSHAILAGIAAADAICGLVLGERRAGDDHARAVAILTQAVRPTKKAPNSLRRLLSESAHAKAVTTSWCSWPTAPRSTPTATRTR